MMSVNRLRKLARDEEGFSLVFVAVGFMAFLGVSMLAIDVGMVMTARNQAQNSADASALAGATALVFDDFTDHSATGPAVQNALTAARANQVMSGTVSIAPGDVEFLKDPSGQSDRVKASVYRDAKHDNPLSTLVAQYFGIATADVAATATAEATPANAETCVKPFTIPDRWKEVGNPPFDSMTSTFDPTTGDVYIPADQPGYTGYDAVADKGTMIMIRAGTGNNITPSFYFSWSMPNGTGGPVITGANWYRNNIDGCNQTLVHWGDLMTQEPGNMDGPTVQGMGDLIAQDPNAYWDAATNNLVSSMHPSPRVFPIPLYDPNYYWNGKVNGRNASLKVANWLGFFVDHTQGNSVYGRITPIPGVIDRNAGPSPNGIFPRVIRLIQ
jgi:Flp pilus assembly protein TadG